MVKIPALYAAQTYSTAKAALQTGPQGVAVTKEGAPSQENMAFKAVHELANTIAQGEKAAQNYMSSGADPHSVIEAIAAAELAVETAVTVRDKVIEAYQELMRMPI